MKLIPALLAATLALVPTQAKATDDPLKTFVTLRAATVCMVYNGMVPMKDAAQWETRRAAEEGLSVWQYRNYNQQSDTGWLKTMIINMIDSVGGCAAAHRKMQQSTPASVYR